LSAIIQKSKEEVRELKAELEVMTMEGNPLNPKGNSLFAEVLAVFLVCW